jgi:hypothetical protein
MMKKLSGAPLTGVAALAALFVWAPAAMADTNDDAYLVPWQRTTLRLSGVPGI